MPPCQSNQSRNTPIAGPAEVCGWVLSWVPQPNSITSSINTAPYDCLVRTYSPEVPVVTDIESCSGEEQNEILLNNKKVFNLQHVDPTTTASNDLATWRGMCPGACWMRYHPTPQLHGAPGWLSSESTMGTQGGQWTFIPSTICLRGRLTRQCCP